MQKFKQGLEIWGLQLKTGASSYLGSFTHSNTADRTYTFPDAAGTLALNTVFTSSTSGLVPSPAGVTNKFLQSDGTWQPVTGSVATTDDAASTTGYPIWTTAVNGILLKTTSTKLSFNASTGALTTTGLTATTGNFASGNFSIDASGNAVTTAGLYSDSLVSRTTADWIFKNSAGVERLRFTNAGAATFSGPVTATSTNNTAITTIWGTQQNYIGSGGSTGNARLTIRGQNYTHGINFMDGYNSSNYAYLSGGYTTNGALELYGFSAQNVQSSYSIYASNLANISGTVTATSFTGAGTGLTGTASSLTAGKVTNTAFSGGGSYSLLWGGAGDNIVYYTPGNVLFTPSTGALTLIGSILSSADATYGWRISNLGAGTGGMTFGTYAGTEWMRITQAGNVGIGTTSPSVRLFISNSTAGASQDGLIISVMDSTAAVTHMSRLYTQQQGAGVSRTLLYAASPTTANTGGKLDILNEAGTKYILSANYDAGSGSYLQLLDDTSTTKVTLSSYGNSYFTGGSLGIGTTTPGTNLEISRLEATNRTTLTNLLTISALANTTPYMGHGGGLLFRGSNYTHNNSLVDYARISATINDSSGVSYGASLGFDVTPTSGTPVLTRAMTIQYDGCVGIGTATPSDKLEIAGAARFVSNITWNASYPGRIYKDSGNGLIIVGVTGTTSDLAIATPAGQSLLTNPTGTNNLALVPLSGGFVGIGIASPSAKLHVTNSGGATNIAKFTTQDFIWGTTGSELLISFGAATGNTYSALTALSAGETVYNNLVLQGSGGNVGIGNTAPSQKLDVTGSGNFSTSVISPTHTLTNGAITSATLTTTTTTADQVVDTIACATARTVKYLVSVKSGTSYQSSEILIVHNDTDVFITEYGTILTGVSLVTFSANILSTNLQLLVTPVNAATTIKAIRTIVNV